jgi:hypothetical protein
MPLPCSMSAGVAGRHSPGPRQIPPVPAGRDERQPHPVDPRDPRQAVQVPRGRVVRQRQRPDDLAARLHPLLRRLVQVRRQLPLEPGDHEEPAPVLPEPAELAAVVRRLVQPVPVRREERPDLREELRSARHDPGHVLEDEQLRRVLRVGRQHEVERLERQPVQRLVLLARGRLGAEEPRHTLARSRAEDDVRRARAPRGDEVRGLHRVDRDEPPEVDVDAAGVTNRAHAGTALVNEAAEEDSVTRSPCRARA